MSIKDYIISKIIRLKIVKDLHEKSKILDLIEKIQEIYYQQQ